MLWIDYFFNLFYFIFTFVLDAFHGYDTADKGYITKDDLRRLLRAHWEVSMEHVQDVVDNLETEMVRTLSAVDYIVGLICLYIDDQVHGRR